ncbi:hypothetical protein DFP72DRAFT_1054015 [Ephemerocybe angulata]|uniref:Uncharacterized protein n=1 Tax=Ephemerocybe angulata TaxID=980116 RepID=A0A8H6HA71_9AGAR|nr:hypothetical protein DFP72DRAFT_1054015 [Tulosesus angulatus]
MPVLIEFYMMVGREGSFVASIPPKTHLCASRWIPQIIEVSRFLREKLWEKGRRRAGEGREKGSYKDSVELDSRPPVKIKSIDEWVVSQDVLESAGAAWKNENTEGMHIQRKEGAEEIEFVSTAGSRRIGWRHLRDGSGRQTGEAVRCLDVPPRSIAGAQRLARQMHCNFPHPSRSRTGSPVSRASPPTFIHAASNRCKPMAGRGTGFTQHPSGRSSSRYADSNPARSEGYPNAAALRA